jgi:hypothetical protein
MTESTKREALRLIERMPEDVSFEDILYELYVRSQIERGLDDLRNDRTVPHEQVMEEMTRWLQSAGR